MKLLNHLLFAAINVLIMATNAASFTYNQASLTELEQAIQVSEKAYSDIVDGSEKHIRWHNNTPQKTKFAFVYLHGFSASRQELSPVTERVADQLGANVFYTRLRGHGRGDDAMAQASIDEWKQDTLEAYEVGKLIGENIIIISTSTGGTLATWLVSLPELENVVANIMISPNFAVQSNSAWLMQSKLGLTIAKWMNGDYNEFTPVSEQHAKYWTERYPLEALTPMLDLVDEIDDLDKSAITVPQFLIYSPRDKVIDVEKVVSTSKEFTSSDVVVTPFNDSTDHVQHVLAGVACSPESTDSMVQIIVNYLKQRLTPELEQ